MMVVLVPCWLGQASAGPLQNHAKPLSRAQIEIHRLPECRVESGDLGNCDLSGGVDGVSTVMPFRQ